MPDQTDDQRQAPEVEASARRAYFDALADALDGQTGNSLAAHVAYRVAALLYPQPPVFVDAIMEQDTSQQEPRRLKGSAVVFTDELLAMIAYHGVRDVSTMTVGEQPVHEGSKVDVMVIARDRLREMALPSADNAGVPWQHAAKDGATFSKHSLLTLRYDGIETPLRLPLTRSAAAAMGPLLQGLARDLAK